MHRFTVIAKTSDDVVTQVLSVETSNFSCAKNSVINKFRKDWDECSDVVCAIDFEKNPVTTNEEQLRLMRERGWTIEVVETEDDPVIYP